MESEPRLILTAERDAYPPVPRKVAAFGALPPGPNEALLEHRISGRAERPLGPSSLRPRGLSVPHRTRQPPAARHRQGMFARRSMIPLGRRQQPGCRSYGELHATSTNPSVSIVIGPPGADWTIERAPVPATRQPRGRIRANGAFQAACSRQGQLAETYPDRVRPWW